MSDLEHKDAAGGSSTGTSPSQGLTVTVVITSRNRVEDLRTCLRSVATQTYPREVLVIDDASTDGTSDMVRTEFPSYRVHRVDQSVNYIVLRNLAARMATGDLIVSLDDDAAFTQPDIITRTVRLFEDPHVGAVAIPYCDVNIAPTVHQQPPDHKHVYVTAWFIGTAHALRRSVFLELSGYVESLVTRGEELDYCIRMLSAGYLNVLGQSAPIHHYTSPKRDSRQNRFYAARNSLLYVWWRVPWRWVPVYGASWTFRQVYYGVRRGLLIPTLGGLISGLFGVFGVAKHRQAASPTVFAVYERLRRQGPMSQESVLLELGPQNPQPLRNLSVSTG